MPSKLELTITSLDILVPVAEAVPILGAPVKGSLEAAKKILEYVKVCAAYELNISCNTKSVDPRMCATTSKPRVIWQSKRRFLLETSSMPYRRCRMTSISYDQCI
jgi:hypothetical protein